MLVESGEGWCCGKVKRKEENLKNTKRLQTFCAKKCIFVKKKIEIKKMVAQKEVGIIGETSMQRKE